MFPINIWFAVSVLVPIPPLEIDKVPNEILEAFNEVKAEPEPTKLVADKVFEVLFHVKFDDCKIDVEPLPIKTWFDVNVVVPIPPLEIDNVPNVTFESI